MLNQARVRVNLAASHMHGCKMTGVRQPVTVWDAGVCTELVWDVHARASI